MLSPFRAQNFEMFCPQGVALGWYVTPFQGSRL